VADTSEWTISARSCVISSSNVGGIRAPEIALRRWLARVDEFDEDCCETTDSTATKAWTVPIELVAAATMSSHGEVLSAGGVVSKAGFG
jgi:hypothetical protein